jgi:hypothetical protein
MIWNKIKKNAYVIIALITAIIFFHPLLFAERTLYFRDINQIFYPMKYFLAHSLKSGIIPFWSPFYFCGAPFLSDIQTGSLYPPSLIFAVFSYPLSLNIYIVFHIFLCFCLAYSFMKQIGVSVSAAILAAIAYAYGGYVLSTINLLINLHVITWLPAILCFYHRALMTKLMRYYLLTILFFCLAILGGEPQLFILSAAIAYSFGIISTSRNIKGIKAFVNYTLIFAILITGSLLITIVQWGPTLLDYQNSVRARGFTFDEVTRFSMSWSTLKHLFIPFSLDQAFNGSLSLMKNLYPPDGNLPWLLSIYPGFIIAPLALLAVFFRTSRETIFWIILFLLGIILSLGHNTPLYYIIYSVFPFFRFPEKYFFLSCISMIILAGYGFDRLKILMARVGIKKIFISVLLPLILFIDLSLVNVHINPTCEIGFYKDNNPFIEPITSDHDLFRVYVDEKSFKLLSDNSIPINYWHTIWQMMMLPNVGIIQNFHYVNGKTGLELEYQSIITNILRKSWPEKIKLLKVANVKYIISAEDLEKQAGTKGSVKRINKIVFQLKNNLPRAWIVGQIIPVTKYSVDDFVAAEFNPFTSALGGSYFSTIYNKPFSQIVSKIDYRSNSSIHLEVNSHQKGVLILSEISYPGWKVRIDGNLAELYRFNFLFQGIEIEAGSHKIEFVYRPPHFLIFLTITIISSIVFICFLIRYRKNENEA